MSRRPATRSKNKGQKVNDDAAVTSRIFRKIHSSGQVTEDDINQLYMITKPVCQGCRINRKDNPNCFCGLIPPRNGSRKSGLWQKTSDILDSLSIDSSNDLRASLESPAGLTNLGATCYTNSILQCLFMNKLFREGIFCVEKDVLKQQPVIDQLARLFAQLHASKMSFIDSAPFIRTLELDNGFQQDSHEFLTLLFSLLEQCLSCSTVARARTVVQDLFRGGVSHVTKCSQCGNESAASSKIEDFYELDLNVKGLKSLDESLNDYLSVEELREDNQYYCESCAARVDATRSIKLRSLPTVLNFQLKRCIFLPNKKKITSAFGFPGELDMSDRLSEHSQAKWLYDLSAVLIHKGSAVNSGHYVAHIKDEDTEQWWEFDDQQVSSLGRHPFGEDSSKSIPKPSSIEPVVHATCSKTTDDVTNGFHADTGELLLSASNNASDAQMFSSSEAYMLTYILRRPKNGGENTQLGSGESSLEKDSSIASTNKFSIPSHLYEEVSKLNESLSDSCEQYKLKKLEMDQITKNREEVRSVLCAAAVQSSHEPYFWISVYWLRLWADNITSPTIDNTPITCLHGKLPVSKLGQAKRLSAKAWTMLFSKYGGGPILAKDDYCTDCILEEARGLVCADSYRERRMLMREIAEAALSGTRPDGKLYYVSKTWLQQWLRRKTIDSPCEADSGPTASIRCPHGELLPEKAAGARRLLIPESLWLFILESANTVKPNDSEGSSIFLPESESCGLCSTLLTEEACKEDSIREFKLKQRQSHGKLAQGKSLAISSISKYYLIPSSWISNWRSFISTSGKNASPPPDSLGFVFQLLKCKQHSRLLKRPPELAWRRGAILQKSPTSDELAIITENDWKLFCKDWCGIDSGGVSARIKFNVNTPMSEEHMDSALAYNDAESSEPIFKTSPKVCEDCIGERESCELMKKLNYCDEDIRVCLVCGKEPPKSILSASEISLELNRRTSKRSRKTTFGNISNFKVSGSTTIYQLKMMIWESFGIVKENQILHKGPKIIDMETATLSDMDIFPGDLLWVKDSEIRENRDIAGNDEAEDDVADDEAPDYLDFRAGRRNLKTKKYADETFISKRLRQVIGNAVTIKNDAFSWATPRLYLPLWNEGENPLPIAVHQVGDTCIPYSILGLINFQFKLIAELSEEPIPEREASIKYLVRRFKLFPRRDRTFQHFLTALHHEGFPLSSDVPLPGLPLPANVPRFGIHWCKGFGPDDYPTVVKFHNALKHSVLFHGGVLAEIYMTDAYDEHGNVSGPKQLVTLDGKKDDETRIYGHGVYIVGWEEIDGILKFNYVNSYGPAWGLKPYPASDTEGHGWVRSMDIHHIYVPQVLKQ